MENKQDCTKVYSIKGYAVQDNGIVRNSYGEYIGQLSDLEECEARGKEIAKLNKRIEDYIDTNAFITKRFDENYEAYKELKEQLEEKEGRIQAINRDRSILRDVIKAKDDLLENMREVLEASKLPVNGMIVGIDKKVFNWELLSRIIDNTLALLPKPLNKEVQEKGSEE